MANTISFFDFNQTLTNKINDYFWELTAERKNGFCKIHKRQEGPFMEFILTGHTNITQKHDSIIKKEIM